MTNALSKMLNGHVSAGLLLCSICLSQALAAQSGDTPPAPLSGLIVDHVTISVENLDRESEWYEKVLGFKITQRSETNPDFLARQLRIPGYRIDLIKYKGSTRPAAAHPLYLQQGWIHIAFNIVDLPAALSELRALNTDVTVGTQDPKGVPTRLVVHDPEGNEVEIFTRHY